MTVNGIIEVSHLIKACDGDPEKLAALAVVLSLASFAFGYTNAQHRFEPGDPHAPARELIVEQIQHWAAAIEEIQRLVIRARAH